MSQEPLYIVRDGAGATYGPAPMPMLRQWIAEGRITPLMGVALQGTEDFHPAGEHPELLSAFPSAPPGAGAVSNPPAFNPGAAGQYGGYPKSSGLAIAALICGICGIFCYGIPGIVGIVLGHTARGQIRREPDRYDGKGMATAGMILGYCFVALYALVVLILILVLILSPNTFR